MDWTTGEPRTNLPAELSSFVGRRHELAQVRAALGAHRLVTLTGPGGVGKTRLALRVAADLAGDHADGAWVVELATVHDPDLVGATVATALGLSEVADGSPVDRLVEHLRDRSVLLVVDNCEHVQDAASALISTLLESCPELHVIATSRHSLGVDGEHLLPVPALSVPAPGREPRSVEGVLHYDSVRLFVDRATASWPAFTLTDATIEAVAQLVRSLDGMPLPIELAAVRVRSLSVPQILERLTDRFSLLNRGDRSALPRQQTLRALLDWSYELLSEQEQALLQRATVFAGSFDLANLEAVVCDESLPGERLAEVVDGLITKSLLVPEDRPDGGSQGGSQGGSHGHTEPRFRILETVKEYGGAKLQDAGRTAALQRRHLEHYRQEVLTAAGEMFGPRGVWWFRRLGAERDDLRAAFERCVGGPGLLGDGCAMLGALQHFLVMTGSFREGRRWTHRFLAQRPPPGVDRAAVLVTGGRLAVLQGDVAQGRPLLERGLEEATLLGSTTWRAHALHGLAITALFWQEPAEAQTLLEEALDLHRRGEDPFGVPLALIQLATVHATLGDTVRAIEYAEQCIALSEGSGEQWCAAMARWTQALVMWREGRTSRVRSYARDVLRLKEPFGDRLGMAMSLEMLAWAACLDQRHEEAAVLFGAVRSALSSIGGALFRPLQADHDRCTELTRSALGAAAFESCLDTGAALDFEDAVQVGLGRRRASGRGRVAQAGDRVRLTRREAEVARLVAEGLTDREIAGRLFVAPRTAEGHVQSSLKKLGLTSRRQLAGWVLEEAP